jgi:hypothetical protein
MKIELRYETEIDDYWGSHTDLVVLMDGVEVGRGSYGGEPEDNTHFRHYDWVRELIATVAKKLGAEVELSAKEIQTDE